MWVAHFCSTFLASWRWAGRSTGYLTMIMGDGNMRRFFRALGLHGWVYHGIRRPLHIPNKSLQSVSLQPPFLRHICLARPSQSPTPPNIQGIQNPSPLLITHITIPKTASNTHHLLSTTPYHQHRDSPFPFTHTHQHRNPAPTTLPEKRLPPCSRRSPEHKLAFHHHESQTKLPNSLLFSNPVVYHLLLWFRISIPVHFVQLISGFLFFAVCQVLMCLV